MDAFFGAIVTAAEIGAVPLAIVFVLSSVALLGVDTDTMLGGSEQAVISAPEVNAVPVPQGRLLDFVVDGATAGPDSVGDRGLNTPIASPPLGRAA